VVHKFVVRSALDGVFSRESLGSVETVARRLTEVAKQHGFGTLHTYDLQEILNSKGFPQTHACQVLEICNPGQADKVLAADYSMNLMLPCRISVYEMGGRTIIAMPKPTALLGLFTEDAQLRRIAEEVETTMVTIVEVTAAGE